MRSERERERDTDGADDGKDVGGHGPVVEPHQNHSAIHQDAANHRHVVQLGARQLDVPATEQHSVSEGGGQGVAQ